MAELKEAPQTEKVSFELTPIELVQVAKLSRDDQQTIRNIVSRQETGDRTEAMEWFKGHSLQHQILDHAIKCAYRQSLIPMIEHNEAIPDGYQMKQFGALGSLLPTTSEDDIGHRTMILIKPKQATIEQYNAAKATIFGIANNFCSQLGISPQFPTK